MRIKGAQLIGPVEGDRVYFGLDKANAVAALHALANDIAEGRVIVASVKNGYETKPDDFQIFRLVITYSPFVGKAPAA